MLMRQVCVAVFKFLMPTLFEGVIWRAVEVVGIRSSPAGSHGLEK